MSRVDLRPLPEESARKIELAKIRHQRKIREVMLAWHKEGLESNHSPPMLSCKQQAELLELVVEMAVDLGDMEGREYLAIALLPDHFAKQIHQLMDAIAAEAAEHCIVLAAEFHLEPSCQNGRGDWTKAVFQRVREKLKPTVDQLIIDALKAHEQRLQAQIEATPLRHALAAQQSAGLAPANLPVIIGEKIERLRLDRGLSQDELAFKSTLTKNTVIGIEKGRHIPHPDTLKKLAGALGVAAGDLLPGPLAPRTLQKLRRSPAKVSSE